MKKTLLLVVLALAACTKSTQNARAAKVSTRAELIGGKRALGEVGDYKLSNGVIQAIVQDVGYSRGFGAFGGSLIDLDLWRGNQGSGTTAPNGNDYFTEMFPAFFLTAVEPSKVEVAADGSDGNAAVIRVTGHGATFLTMVKPLTDVANPNQPLDFTVDYILEPGKPYLKMQVTLTNPGPDTGFNLPVPFGAVTLLGEGQQLFINGEAGFDVRYHLEDVVYKRAAALNALPGEVTPMWSTAGDGVSYAFVVARPKDGNYMEGKPDYYPTAKGDWMLLPIAYSSFLGAYWAKAPQQLPHATSFTYSSYLAVGSGDVASAQRAAYGIRDAVIRPNGNELVYKEKTPYGTISGRVTETETALPLKGISVVLQDDQGGYQSQALTLSDGRYSAPVPAGKYRAYAVDSVRSVVVGDSWVDVAEGGSAELNLSMAQPGALEVVVRDESGRGVPAKVSVEGVYENPTPGELPRKVLYNLAVGEQYRVSDLIPDDPNDPNTRRYMERIFPLLHGSGSASIRPGHYKVYVSRGIEYDVPSQEVDITTGHTSQLAFTLKHVQGTPGWASGDFHVHSVKSVDSNMGLEDRVTAFAVEGVDYLASTDHNYVVDYQPTIDALQLADWLKSGVGLELTSLEMGHFNAFPVDVQPGPVTHGSFRWFFRPPGELFAQLRGLGRDPQKTVVQINHPRDTIMGYFNAFNVGTYVGKPIPATSAFVLDTSPQADGSKSPYDYSNFSLDFDAMEIFNGKRFDIMRSYRMPLVTPPGPEPALPSCPTGPTDANACLPLPGAVLEKAVNTAASGQPPVWQKTPAYPGAQDDWYTLLGLGHHITATGNSDTHAPKSEAGLPRTYVEVGLSADGSMRGLDEDAIYAALREGRAVVTNGPFIAFSVNGQGPGHTVVQGQGKVDVAITVTAAPWVDVQRVVLKRGDKTTGAFPEVLETFTASGDGTERLKVTKSYTVPDGSYLVVEAIGDRPMWPVFTPHEVTSVQISDAVGVIGGAFGFGDKYGKYGPSQLQQVTPYGFTNPVYVSYAAQQPLTAPKWVISTSASEPFKPRTLPDLRRLYGSMHTDL